MDTPRTEAREPTGGTRKGGARVGDHTETSGVDPNKRPYPIDGTWERYTFKVGNIRFLMMGDRNDLPYPVGRRATGGASPAGAVTPETFAWWTSHVESAGKDEIIITGDLPVQQPTKLKLVINLKTSVSAGMG